VEGPVSRRSNIADQWNGDAEAGLLASILVENTAISKINGVQPEDFFDPHHRVVFEAMRELDADQKPIDPLTLEEVLARDGKLKAIGGLSFLTSLVGKEFNSDNAAHYADIIHGLGQARRIRLGAADIAACGEDIEELVAKAHRYAQWVERLAAPKAAQAPGMVPYGMPADVFLGDEDDVEDDSRDWVVRGFLLASAPNIIAGPPKSKKTLVALHLMICITAGLELWLGRFPITAGRVLVLAHEDPKRETRRRLWRLARGLGLDPRDLSGTLTIADRSDPFHFDREKEMDRMVSTIEATQPSVILMDSLSRVHLGDENSKRDMNVVTDAWLTLAAKYNVAITTIHHPVKLVQGKGLIEQLRGSGDIGAAARHVVGVTKDGKDDNVLSVRTEGNSAYQPDPLNVTVVDEFNDRDKPTILLRADSNPVLEAIEQRILSVLAVTPHSTRLLRAACRGIEGMRNEMVDAVIASLKGRLIRRLTGGGPWILI